VPLGVLQAGALRFTPELGDHAAAIARLAVGQVVKVVLSLRAPIWREVEPALSFVHPDAQPFGTCWVRSRGNSHHVIAWAGGPRARALAAVSHVERVERAVATFAACLGLPVADIAAEVRAVYAHDYAAEPWQRGAYSYPRPGGLDAPGVLERPLGGRLWFAGEATSGPYEGTVTGALASGARAAADILRARGRV
jgi:monoamine oxidase